MKELLREIFARVPPVNGDIPDSNPFDIRVTVGQLRRARALLADSAEPPIAQIVDLFEALSKALK